MDPDRPTAPGVRSSDRPAHRVAQPGALFWTVKIITTGAGETTSDLLVRTYPPEVVVPATFLVLVAALLLQLRARAYRPARYWSTALMVSIFGTMAADVLHVGLGVPYAVSTAGFAVALVALLLVQWRTEGTLSVRAITSAPRERCYWAVVMTTFALGTAAGDLAATTLGLGYLGAGVLFLVLFALPGVVLAGGRRGEVAAFWTAYVMTRPLGASFADWCAAPRARGGLDLGTGPVSLVLLLVLTALVGILSVRRRPATTPAAG